jgi:hypothetical protein
MEVIKTAVWWLIGSTNVQILFDVIGEGSSTTLNDVDVDSNSGSFIIGPLTVLKASNGASATLRNSTIQRNNPMLVSYLSR